MAEWEDPLVGFHFSVDLSGTVVGLFTECSGLGSEHEIIEHKVTQEGKEIIMKIPGRLKWEDITLKKGITKDMAIWDWRKEIENGKVDENRRDGSITMFNQKLEPVAQWNFTRGWPSKVSGPQPKSDSNEVGLEEMIITHEYIERVSV